MDNPEKLASQDEEKQNKNTTQYILDTTIRQTNTNNVIKTWALPQITGAKNEPNISLVFIRVLNEVPIGAYLAGHLSFWWGSYQGFLHDDLNSSLDPEETGLHHFFKSTNQGYQYILFTSLFVSQLGRSWTHKLGHLLCLL